VPKDSLGRLQTIYYLDIVELKYLSDRDCGRGKKRDAVVQPPELGCLDILLIFQIL
jgi:hypothetical protein